MRLSANRPAEQRGQTRDSVRLLVATTDGLAHARFSDLPRFLIPGDLLVVNTSATLAAAVDGHRGDGRPVTVHFSTPLDDGTWVAELRETSQDRSRVTDAEPGETLTLPGDASLTLLFRYPDPAAARLWVTAITGLSNPDGGGEAFLAAHGRPIRYSYVPDEWPLSAYQTVFSRDPGSAEMPSAGRPFTADLVLDLITSGVVIAPITLHAGVASLEAGEQPLPERFSVPESTARLVNLTRSASRRVVAAGTTVTRAVPGAGCQRADHWLARPRGLAPGAARGRRRPGSRQGRVRRSGQSRGPRLSRPRIRGQLPPAPAHSMIWKDPGSPVPPDTSR